MTDQWGQQPDPSTAGPGRSDNSEPSPFSSTWEASADAGGQTWPTAPGPDAPSTGPTWSQPATPTPARPESWAAPSDSAEPPAAQPWQQTPPPPGPPAPYAGEPAPAWSTAPAAGPYGAAPYGVPPDNYLVWAILATIFCCLPVGIPAIVFASQVNSKWAAGDVAGAEYASKRARQLATWAAIAGVAFTVIYFAFGIIATMMPGS